MNDADFLKSMAAEYVKGDKTARLEADLTKEDWKDYRVTVHAVKSTSLNIGLPELSHQALELETALKEDRTAYVKEHHAGFMEEYRSALEKLRALIRDY